jgi:hypothetical protein
VIIPIQIRKRNLAQLKELPAKWPAALHRLIEGGNPFNEPQLNFKKQQVEDRKRQRRQRKEVRRKAKCTDAPVPAASVHMHENA